MPLTITEDGNSNDGQAGEADNVMAVEHIILGSARDKAIGDGSNNTLEGRNGNDQRRRRHQREGLLQGHDRLRYRERSRYRGRD